MTQDQIILMADASGISLYGMGKDRAKFIHYLEAFAKLVAEKAFQNGYEKGVAAFNDAVLLEREACAKVCDDKHDTWRWDDEADSASGPRDCAAAIRARGQA
jgi:hypothetical protein